MKKTIAALALTGALAVPSVAMAATIEADDTTSGAVTCPYYGQGTGYAEGVMTRNRIQARVHADECDGACAAIGAGEGHGYGVRDGSGPIELQAHDGTGFRHGANR